MAMQDAYAPFKKMMANYYGNPSKEEIKEAAKEGGKKALKDPRVAIPMAAIPIPGGQAVAGARVAKTAGGAKVVGKAVSNLLKGVKKIVNKTKKEKKSNLTRMPETDAERYLREYGKPLRPNTKEEAEFARKWANKIETNPIKAMNQRRTDTQNELNAFRKKEKLKAEAKKQAEEDAYRKALDERVKGGYKGSRVPSEPITNFYKWME